MHSRKTMEIRPEAAAEIRWKTQMRNPKVYV